MAIKEEYSEYRVVVYTDEGWMSSKDHERMMSRSRDLAEQVDRHCDGQGKAEVHFTTERFCDKCGSVWNEENDVYNGCCEENEAEAKAAGFDFAAHGHEEPR